MNRTIWLQERRMEKFHDALEPFESKRLSALDAAELLGMSERTFRRYRQRYEAEGLEGLFDRRLGKVSTRRVPVDAVTWAVEEYRTCHAGWTVKHFHDRLRARHGFVFSYTWTNTVLQGAGLVRKAPRRASPPPAARRARRPARGSLLWTKGTSYRRCSWYNFTPPRRYIVAVTSIVMCQGERG